MRIFAPGFLLGVCFIFDLKTLPPCWCFALIWLVGLGFYFYWRHMLSLLILAMLSGVLWAGIYGHFLIVKPLPLAQEGQVQLVTGFITGLPEVASEDCAFYFNAQHVGLLKLAWYNHCPALKPGDIWQLSVKLKRARGLSNPGTFDFEAWAIQKGIVATGYVVDKGNQNKCIQSRSLNALIDQLRYHLKLLQQTAFPAIAGSDFIPAVTIGDRDQINKDEWQVLQNTGTNHLVAIAGLHIGLVTGLIFFLVKWLWKRLPYFCLRLASQRAAAFCALWAAFMYGSLAGFELPTRRALVMLTVLFLGTLCNRRVPPWHGYALAMFLVVAIDPSVVLSMSFWMSFMAVGVIIYAITGNLGHQGKLKQTFKMQLAVSIGVLPCTIWFFQKASLVSPLVNAIVVPLVGFIVIPLGLLGTFLLLVNHWVGAHVLWLSAYAMQGVWWILQHMSALPLGEVDFAFPTFGVLCFFCAGLALLLFPRGFPFKYLSLFILAPVFFVKKPDIPLGGVQFTMLDVGQGLSSVVQTQNHVLVFDTGPAQFGGLDSGEVIVTPFLRKSGIKKIDEMIISHGDNDHAGGARAIATHFKIDHVRSSVPKKFPAAWHATNCWRNQSWQWDGVDFQILAPYQGQESKSNNNLSCVLKVTAGQHAILLTGDIEKPSERVLLDESKNELKADILQVPHHGSRTSSSQLFVEAVHPEYALFPLGYLNRFHFPSKIVVARYQDIGSKQYDSAKSGAIIFKIDPKTAINSPIQYRLATAKWWSY